MEKKEDGKSLNENEIEPSKEKIAYKVVPVPYYYPVPVDAESYYKNYERYSRQNERFFRYEDFEHFPPPSFPFPRVRERHFQGDRFHSPDRFRRSISPSDSLSPRYVLSPPPEREYSEEGELPLNDSVESIKKEETHKDGEKEKEIKQEKNEDEKSEDETKTEKDDERTVEVGRKRKRYMMTFPYDQRKRQMSEESRQNRNSSEEHGEGVYESQMMYPQNRRPMVSSHVPYVMVPMRSPGFMSSDMVRGPRYMSEHHTFEERSYVYESRHRKSDESHESRSVDERENEKEARYHSNGRRARTVFTRQQLLTLNNVFEKHPFVSGERMSELSDQLGLDRKIVKIWFQNKRQYARKKGSLLEREDDYFYEYNDRYRTSTNAPTMAERWKNGN